MPQLGPDRRTGLRAGTSKRRQRFPRGVRGVRGAQPVRAMPQHEFTPWRGGVLGGYAPPEGKVAADG